jgi:hypothetical protein
MVASRLSAAALSALVPTAPRDLVTPSSAQTRANSFDLDTGPAAGGAGARLRGTGAPDADPVHVAEGAHPGEHAATGARVGWIVLPGTRGSAT